MMINKKLVQMIVIIILLTMNLKAHLKTIIRKLKVLIVIMNVHRVRQFNQRNKTTNNNLTIINNNNLTIINNKIVINNLKITMVMMTQEQINEWNKNKPTTHDESQMGYGREDYEQALKESQKVGTILTHT